MQKLGRNVAPGLPFAEEDSRAIRQQMERMLASPLFRNSKRFPALWRYVVDQTLEGHGSDLKERTLGVQVFGRDPDYDTNADPIVRVTAGEIRKRIAQYYDAEEHRSEIRINLSPGSYIPEFEFPAIAAEPDADPGADRHSVRPVDRPEERWLAWRSAAAGFLAATAIVVVVAIGVLWSHTKQAPAALDRLWAPIIDSAEPALVCLGQRTFLANAQEPQQPPNPDFENVGGPPPNPNDKEIRLSQLYHLGSQNVTLPDANTLGRVIGLLNLKGKRYRILGEHTTSLADLRAGPTVLIGAYNNDWTLRLTNSMPFSFEREGTKRWIQDRRTTTRSKYLIDYETPYLSLNEDYAVVARFVDPTTERVVVVIAGLAGYGTVAAGEFVTSPEYMQAAVRDVSDRWGRKNMEWVIATKVINGNSGPPRVLDQSFW